MQSFAILFKLQKKEVTKVFLDVEKTTHANFDGYIEALKRLVRIPSISFDNFDQKFVQQSAEAVKAMFEEAGLKNVQFLLPPSGSVENFSSTRVSVLILPL